MKSKTKSMILWATYQNCMDCVMDYAKANKNSHAEYEFMLKSANKILDKWFLVTEAEITVKRGEAEITDTM
jgi:hypothetical protein